MPVDDTVNSVFFAGQYHQINQLFRIRISQIGREVHRTEHHRDMPILRQTPKRVAVHEPAKRFQIVRADPTQNDQLPCLIAQLPIHHAQSSMPVHGRTFGIVTAAGWQSR